jgi:predicted alpha/beta superfamily hydrolase
MKLLFLVLFSLPLLCRSQDITTGKQEKIHSRILNEDRTYIVYMPESTKSKIYAKQEYPVIYLLDGDIHFKGLAGIMESLTPLRVLPEAIIIAILPKDRIKELTPTPVTSGIFIDSLSAKTAGGGEDFTAFLQKELIPHVDSVYAAAPYRMLIGHALGGLFVINTLIHHTELFNAYIAIDPALWWDNQKLVKDAEEVFKQRKFDGRSLYLPIATAFKPAADTLKKNRTPLEEAILSYPDFIRILRKNPGSGLKWSTREYPAEGHNSLPLIAEYDALHEIFSAYNFLSPDNQELYNASLNSTAVMKMLSSGYSKISIQAGYEIIPSETVVNDIGYAYISAGKAAEAYPFFEMNQKNYPLSFNVYDAMGDYYYAIDNIPRAIEQYRKAINIFYEPGTADKLKKLQGEREH